jgi:HTH-type transcriptional regulator/antitoxin HigA
MEDMSVLTQELQLHWAAISPLLTIHNEQEYDRAIERLHRLIDEVGTDEQHPLYELLDTLAMVIHAYEEQHYPIPPVSGAEVLEYLMEEHGLAQSALSEVGSQGVVSEILSGKRELNVRQIRALAQRFGVSPAVFF